MSGSYIWFTEEQFRAAVEARRSEFLASGWDAGLAGEYLAYHRAARDPLSPDEWLQRCSALTRARSES